MNINQFLIWSDDADTYEPYQKRLDGHEIQESKQKRKRQKTYQASRRMRLNEVHESKLQKATVVRNDQSFPKDLYLDSSQSLHR